MWKKLCAAPQAKFLGLVGNAKSRAGPFCGRVWAALIDRLVVNILLALLVLLLVCIFRWGAPPPPHPFEGMFIATGSLQAGTCHQVWTVKWSHGRISGSAVCSIAQKEFEIRGFQYGTHVTGTMHGADYDSVFEFDWDERTLTWVGGEWANQGPATLIVGQMRLGPVELVSKGLVSTVDMIRNLFQGE